MESPGHRDWLASWAAGMRAGQVPHSHCGVLHVCPCIEMGLNCYFQQAPWGKGSSETIPKALISLLGDWRGLPSEMGRFFPSAAFSQGCPACGGSIRVGHQSQLTHSLWYVVPGGLETRVGDSIPSTTSGACIRTALVHQPQKVCSFKIPCRDQGYSLNNTQPDFRAPALLHDAVRAPTAGRGRSPSWASSPLLHLDLLSALIIPAQDNRGQTYKWVIIVDMPTPIFCQWPGQEYTESPHSVSK